MAFMDYVVYITEVLRHKYYVLVYGLRLRVSLWQLLMHDASKFSPAEFFPYAKFFIVREKDLTATIHDRFKLAWHHHKHHNPHHPEFWFFLDRSAEVTVMEMPERYAREWLADIMAADKVYSYKGKVSLVEWLKENFPKFKFHPATRQFLVQLIKEHLGFDLQ